MKFDLHVYPKKGIYLKGDDKHLLKLVENGIIEEGEDGLAYFTQGIRLSVVTESESLEKFIDEQWIPLFPTHLIRSGTSSYRATGSRKEVIRNMRDFLKQYKTRFSYDCIFISTAAYLYERSTRNFDYTLKTHNFIRKELESWCLAYEQDPKDLFQKAKLYYEYVRRTATRTRKKRVDNGQFGRSAILERGIARDGTGGNVARGQSCVGDGDTRGEQRADSNSEGDRHLRPGGTIKLEAKAIRINKSHKDRTE